jgi:hypothetical protein
VIGRRFFNAPINGDFELVQMATAISVFSFLPYCQAGAATSSSTPSHWLPPRIACRCLLGPRLCRHDGLLGGLPDTGGRAFRSGQTTMLLQ